MRTYRMTIGNTEPRKGHRRDCAQLSAVILIHANSPPQALKKLKARSGSLRSSNGGMEVSLTFGDVDERDMEELGLR